MNLILFGARHYSGGDEIQRWTAGRKAAVVMDVIKGKATPADLVRQHDRT